MCNVAEKTGNGSIIGKSNMLHHWFVWFTDEEAVCETANASIADVITKGSWNKVWKIAIFFWKEIISVH